MHAVPPLYSGTWLQAVCTQGLDNTPSNPHLHREQMEITGAGKNEVSLVILQTESREEPPR